MLDQIIKLVQQHGGATLGKSPAIPAGSQPEATKIIAQEIFSGLQGQAKSGNAQGLVSMFSGGTSDLAGNPMVSQIISGAAAKLASKFGISPDIAQQITSSVIPVVMSQFVKKTNDPNDKDFELSDVLKNFTGNTNVNDILGKITGGKGGGLGGALGGMFGNR